MSFLSLANQNDVSKTLRDKIKFYTLKNIFRIETQIVGSEDFANISIKKNTPSLHKKISLFIKQVNILYVKEKNFKWDIMTVINRPSPIIIINTLAIERHYKEYTKDFNSFKEAVAYVNIFGFLSTIFGQSCQFGCFGNFQQQEKNSLTFTTLQQYEQLARLLFENYKHLFMLYLQSEDDGLNTFFRFGKKYVFSLTILFDRGEIGITKASELLDMLESEAFAFFEEYKGVAYINFLKHKTGEFIC